MHLYLDERGRLFRLDPLRGWLLCAGRYRYTDPDAPPVEVGPGDVEDVILGCERLLGSAT